VGTVACALRPLDLGTDRQQQQQQRLAWASEQSSRRRAGRGRAQSSRLFGLSASRCLQSVSKVPIICPSSSPHTPATPTPTPAIHHHQHQSFALTRIINLSDRISDHSTTPITSTRISAAHLRRFLHRPPSHSHSRPRDRPPRQSHFLPYSHPSHGRSTIRFNG